MDAPQPLPDILAKGLALVFCGINPGLTAATAGHHFVSGSNRFWRTIHLAGFTPRRIEPQNDRDILHYGCGLTTAVNRPSVRADEIAATEFLAQAAALERKIAHYAPRTIAFLGKAAYAVIAGNAAIEWGPQPALFGRARVWVVPNPSGLNRAYTLDALVRAYSELWRAVHGS